VMYAIKIFFIRFPFGQRMCVACERKYTGYRSVHVSPVFELSLSADELSMAVSTEDSRVTCGIPWAPSAPDSRSWKSQAWVNREPATKSSFKRIMGFLSKGSGLGREPLVYLRKISAGRGRPGNASAKCVLWGVNGSGRVSRKRRRRIGTQAGNGRPPRTPNRKCAHPPARWNRRMGWPPRRLSGSSAWGRLPPGGRART
jgi:hypothetical protein